MDQTHGGYQFNVDNPIAIAWDKSVFDETGEKGTYQVGKDRPDQYYGYRYVAWARFIEKSTGKGVWFGTLHGPLPVNTGGSWGQTDVSNKIMKSIQYNSKEGDLTILTGDFNEDWNKNGNGYLNNLARELDRIPIDQDNMGKNPLNPNGWHFDNIYVNKGMLGNGSARSIGTGGSDHPLILANWTVDL